MRGSHTLYAYIVTTLFIVGTVVTDLIGHNIPSVLSDGLIASLAGSLGISIPGSVASGSGTDTTK